MYVSPVFLFLFPIVTKKVFGYEVIKVQFEKVN